VIAHLRASGVQQSSKDDRITFTSVTPWPGELIAAEGRFLEGTHGARESTADGGPGSPNPGPGADDDGSRFGDRDPQHVPAPDGEGQPRERTAAIFIGPEFGTVARGDLMRAVRETNEADFDILVACAFNFEAHASEVTRLGGLRIVRARMNPELHMSDDLKNTGTGNLFVVFGEPDIAIEDAGGDHVRVRIQGLDIFDPSKGEVRAGGTDGGHQNDIAAWFIDTDYDAESFFVRHAYFLGGHDPYKALKTALKAEIDEDAWASLHRDVSRPFPRPETGRIAVKVINHFGDEVMQVFGV